MDDDCAPSRILRLLGFAGLVRNQDQPDRKVEDPIAPLLQTSWPLQRELLRALEPFLARQLKLVPPASQAWQPSDFLPLDNKAAALEVYQLCREISADIIFVLAGNAITEEALPSYSAALRRIEGMREIPGDSASPWMEWSRAWTAEENRHGELLSRFLLLSGRVNGPQFERAIHTLIRNGFDTGDAGDPIRTFVYTSFQERATKLSHLNVSRLADRAGASLLAKICRVIGADEARHEEIYGRIMAELFKIAPNEALGAYSHMMRLKITMPARLLGETAGVNLFSEFSRMAEQLGVYTTEDYITIIEHLNSRWAIADLGVSGIAAAHQEYLCGLPGRMRRVVQRRQLRPARESSLHDLEWVRS